MTAFAAFLRAVNLAGHQPVAMAELRKLATELGFHGARTLLQSGNLVFVGGGFANEIEAVLERGAAARLGLRTQFFVRTAEELEAAMAGNPFAQAAADDPGHLVVMFLKAAPSRAQAQALQAAITGPERTHVDDRQAYIAYPEGIGRSRLTTALIERKLGTSGTGRNWNTFGKVLAAAKSL